MNPNKMNSKNLPQINAQIMTKLLLEAGISLNQEQTDKLWAFHRHLKEEDKELNLTRIHSFSGMIRKHYVDSLIILDLFKKMGFELPETLIDLGSGAGLPGIPLAIACPKTHFILTEGRKKRVEYLEKTVKLLGLQNVSVYGKKIYRGDKLPAPALISRALEKIQDTFDRVWGSLPEGGFLIFMKGPNCDEEKNAIEQNGRYRECRLLLDESYTLPHSSDRRRLLIWEIHYPEKIRETMKEDLKIISVSSSQNPRFRTLLKLQDGRQIAKLERALVSGRRIVEEILSNRSEEIEALIVPNDKKYISESDAGFHPHPFLISELAKCSGKKPAVWVLERSLFREADIFNTEYPLLLLRVSPIATWNPELDTEGTTVLIPFGDPENVGAAVRSASAFRVSRVVLLKEAANPYHPRAIRASAGECFKIPFFSGPSIIDINSIERPILLLDKRGISINSLQEVENNWILLAGHEGGGVPENNSFQKISIPISDGVDSLNAAVALGIALFSLNKR